jgi:hypothetical protein
MKRTQPTKEIPMPTPAAPAKTEPQMAQIVAFDISILPALRKAIDEMPFKYGQQINSILSKPLLFSIPQSDVDKAKEATKQPPAVENYSE